MSEIWSKYYSGLKLTAHWFVFWNLSSWIFLGKSVRNLEKLSSWKMSRIEFYIYCNIFIIFLIFPDFIWIKNWAGVGWTANYTHLAVLISNLVLTNFFLENFPKQLIYELWETQIYMISSHDWVNLMANWSDQGDLFAGFNLGTFST